MEYKKKLGGGSFLLLKGEIVDDLIELRLQRLEGCRQTLDSRLSLSQKLRNLGLVGGWRGDGFRFFKNNRVVINEVLSKSKTSVKRQFAIV